MRTWLETTLAKHSNRTAEQVNRDIDRDKILVGREAVDYGLVDQVLTTRKRDPAALDEVEPNASTPRRPSPGGGASSCSGDPPSAERMPPPPQCASQSRTLVGLSG